MQKILLNVKTDPLVKREAQEVARELGLPLGTIINAYLRELVREKRVIFSIPPVPNQRTQRILKEIQRDMKSKKKFAGPFTYDEALAYLDTL